MPPIVNKLGPFYFHSIEPPPEPRIQHITTMRRPGVDGVAFAREGTWGENFNITTRVDVQNYELAWQRYLLYQELLDQDPQELVWANINMLAYSLKFQVVRVQKTELSPLLASVNAMYPPGLALLVCQWELCPVEHPLPTP